MNQVSWLIYLSDISDKIGGLLVFFGFVVLIVAAAYFIVSLVQLDNLSKYNNGNAENKEVLKIAVKTRRFIPALIVLSSFFWLMAVFAPSKDTVLAIAASQVGEQVLKSPTGNLATQALDAWLKRQMAMPPPAKAE